MIDRHGQLWIADFGLARRAAESDLTMTGDLLGTLRYMSPEQALAKHDLVDHRSDVYSLGATLYELLTLTPAAEGKDRQDIIQHITQSDVTSLRRHNRGIPADLETIVLKALAKEPDGRYATAKELADDLRRCMNHEPIRARRPSVRQRMTKWGQRNRPAVIAATVAAFVITMVLGAAAGFEYQSDQARAARERDKVLTRQDQLAKDMNRHFDEAENRREEIHAKLLDPIKASQIVSRIDGWKSTLAQARAAHGQAKNLTAKNEDLLTADLSARVQKLDEQLLLDETEWQVAKDLDGMRLGSATLVNGVWNPGAIDKGYDKLFRSLGIDFDDNNPAIHAKIIERSNLRFVLVAALDYWGIVTNRKSRVGTLLATARLADPDPWRDRVRTESNWTKPEILNELAKKADLSRQSPQVIHLLAVRLNDNKIDAVPFLRNGLLHHPNDFWLHLQVVGAIPSMENVIGHYYAALAIRNDSSAMHNNLAYCLRHVKDLDGAIRHFRKALECDPLHIVSHLGIAESLREAKNDEEADKHLQVASDLANKNATGNGIVEHDALIHKMVGDSLYAKKEFDAAIRHYGKATEWDPNLATAECHWRVGQALRRKNDLNGAIRHYRKVIELDPSITWAHVRLADVLRQKKDFASAIHTWNQFFMHHPALADNLNAGCRFRAARDALLASGHQDLNAGNFTDAERIILRRQAYEWLHAELISGSKQLQMKEPDAVLALANALPQWEKSPELTGVRDARELTKLPEEERKSWQKLWTEVARLRKQASGMFMETARLSGVVASKRREVVHLVELQAGAIYGIDLESSEFDTFLRLEDVEGKNLVENDDIELGVNRNSRVIFTPDSSGAYRVAASAFQNSGTGHYTLTIREFVK